MNRTRVLLISLLVAGFALFMLYAYISKTEKALLESATPIPVVVAVRDLAQDTRIDETLVQIKKVPKKYVQPGAVTDVADIFDRVLGMPVRAGTQVLEAMFKSADTESLAKMIPAGKRAISVAVSEKTAAAGLVQPGDFVDIYISAQTGGYDELGRLTPEETLTKLILQNVLVLANNQTSSKAAYERAVFQDKQPGTAGNTFRADLRRGEKTRKVRTLTVALSPVDAQKLATAQQVGNITVTLRNSWGEEKDVDIAPITAKKLLGVDKKVISTGMPSWVEIRGTQRVTE